MNTGRPKLNVVMPVYNAMPYLDSAISSILNQKMGNFRLAIFDDHSTDGSYERAMEWAARDPRIVVSRGENRSGPTASSAAAAALADSEFVARMDADDVCMPDRFEIQMTAMLANPEAALVGSTFDIIDGEGHLIRPARPGHKAGGASPFAHSSIFYRQSAFEAAGGYRADTDYFEDFDLYQRMGAFGPLLVINRPLIQVRFAGQNNRLNEDAEMVLSRMDKCFNKNDDEMMQRRISPTSFYALAILSVFGRQRPKLLPLMFRRMSIKRRRRAFIVSSFLIISEISPKIACILGRMTSTALRSLNAKRYSNDEVYVWHRE